MESRNWPIIGQSKALNFFDKLLNFEEITPGRLGGSFILAGGESLGKTTVLELFICKLLKISNFEIVNSDIARLEPGDVIPEIVQVLLKKRPKDSKPFKMPKKCPICSAPVHRFEDEAATRCTNLECPAILKGALIHFVSRKAMNVDGLGDRLIEA
jgi:NAD-dependent DNA ligase